MANSYFWACDFKENSGEGKLARLFVKYKQNITNKKFIQIKAPKLNMLNYKYFSPIVGIFYCWVYFFKKRDIYYINFLPFWNVILFIFLPPGTKFGPITGGAEFDRTKKNIIRKNVFPVLYKISEIFINIREQRIFSTELLKKYLSKTTIKNSKFNYVFNFINVRKIKRRKDIDFIIYNRCHKNKKPISKNIIKKLQMNGFKIIVVGDYLDLPNVKNYGYINNKNINYLLNRALFTLPSEENLYSIFVIECIENDVKILINSEILKNIKYYKSHFMRLNINNLENLKKFKKKYKKR